MNTRKELRKKIKGPDFLQEEALKLFEYISLNGKTVTAYVFAGIALLGLGMLVNSYFDSQALERKESFSSIDLIFNKELDVAADQKEAVEKKLEVLNKKTTKTEDDNKKIKTLESEIKGIVANHTNSSKKYLEYYNSHKDTAEGWASGLKYLATQKEVSTDQKKSILKSIIEKSKTNSFYQTYGRFLLLGVLENTKEYDEALKVGDELISYGSDELKAQTLLSKGRILLKKNDLDQAITLFESILKDFKDTPEATQARGLIAISKHKSKGNKTQESANK